jgi:drug/metabolite transporter (DMT)-like permease
MASLLRLFTLTLLAMVAFAANSVLCRLALDQTSIDAASFTSIRLIAGAAVLGLIISLRQRGQGFKTRGSWPSALALFTYAAGFSFAYISLPAATGALLLFGSVQISMIGYGIAKGERTSSLQKTGLVLALVGLTVLLLPGASAPSLAGASLMVVAGIAWAVYSLRGKAHAGDPTGMTAGNFLRTIPFTLVLSAALVESFSVDSLGIIYAIASGGIASGLGYALWYAALPKLQAMTAASVQLSVPVITALGGALFLDEQITLQMVLASTAILGGIALVVRTADMDGVGRPATKN